MRNPIYEQALTHQGVEWDYLEYFDLSLVNETRSIRNQARLDMPVDEDLVGQYAAAMRNGDKFPPLVVYKVERSVSYILIDGNQRFKAYGEARVKEADAYLVKSKDEMVLNRLTWVFNILVNGKRLSPEECLEHALTMVAKYGWSAKQAAEEWHLYVKKVTNALKMREVREVVDRRAGKLSNKLPDTHLEKISPLLKAGEDVLVKAAEVVVSSGITAKEADVLAEEVSKAKTHDDKVKVIEQAATSELFQRRKAETKGGSITLKNPLPRDRFQRPFKEVYKLLGEFDAKALRPPSGPPFKEFREQVKEVIDNLIKLAQLGQPLCGRPEDGKEAAS